MEYYKKHLHHWVAVLLYMISHLISICLLDWLPLKTGNPSDNLPWYFIGVDFKNFLASVFCLIIAIPLFYFMFKNERIKFRDGLLFLSFLLMPPILLGIWILLRTKNIFNDELATTTIKTLDEFLRMKNWSFYIILITGFCLIVYRNWFQTSNKADAELGKQE
ncbi:MAG: hypothetical protein JNK41_10115 [Saprospiraceae bacterium]|jgi:hypothetical protein|nr:hypothetical protein [Saprospiraceae bacterium]